MTDFKTDNNNNILQKATKNLRLRFPIADISKKVGYNKGDVSSFLNNKKPVSDEFLKKFADAYNIKLDDYKDFEEQKAVEPKEAMQLTGYYYPNVSASAGMDKEIISNQFDKIPINIPNWESGIDFINVYGDSMYPKFCSGEIIGVKEVELSYINYGFAYVVILNDGQVLLKFIKKGSDKEHIILESENKFYEPKEFHISQLKKVFIIKGVITKTTM